MISGNEFSGFGLSRAAWRDPIPGDHVWSVRARPDKPIKIEWKAARTRMEEECFSDSLEYLRQFWHGAQGEAAFFADAEKYLKTPSGRLLSPVHVLSNIRSLFGLPDFEVIPILKKLAERCEWIGEGSSLTREDCIKMVPPDLTVTAQDTVFPAHKCVLMQHDFFKTRMESPGIVQLPDHHPHKIQTILNWLYDGSFPTDPVNQQLWNTEGTPRDVKFNRLEAITRESARCLEYCNVVDAWGLEEMDGYLLNRVQKLKELPLDGEMFEEDSQLFHIEDGRTELEHFQEPTDSTDLIVEYEDKTYYFHQLYLATRSLDWQMAISDYRKTHNADQAMRIPIGSALYARALYIYECAGIVFSLHGGEVSII
ncbi:MAG: BTB/POZ domain-containing protein [Chlamydiales bacterium]|nr:BTB/POZ domain-containing protein [Chlamydiales bacterium]